MPKEYSTLDEAAKQIGIGRATLYRRMRALHITATKFKGMDKRAYLSGAQIKQIKEAQDMPWLATKE